MNIKQIIELGNINRNHLNSLVVEAANKLAKEVNETGLDEQLAFLEDHGIRSDDILREISGQGKKIELDDDFKQEIQPFVDALKEVDAMPARIGNERLGSLNIPKELKDLKKAIVAKSVCLEFYVDVMEYLYHQMDNKYDFWKMYTYGFNRSHESSIEWLNHRGDLPVFEAVINKECKVGRFDLRAKVLPRIDPEYSLKFLFKKLANNYDKESYESRFIAATNLVFRFPKQFTGFSPKFLYDELAVDRNDQLHILNNQGYLKSLEEYYSSHSHAELDSNELAERAGIDSSKAEELSRELRELSEDKLVPIIAHISRRFNGAHTSCFNSVINREEHLLMAWRCHNLYSTKELSLEQFRDTIKSNYLGKKTARVSDLPELDHLFEPDNDLEI